MKPRQLIIATALTLLATTLLLSCLPPDRRATRTTPAMTFADNPVVAHRGAWKARGLPENSIAALRHAIALGCTGAEFDVWMTADDTLVVNHDAEHAGRAIEESTYADLVETPLANGERLPTLREYLLEGLRQNPRTRLVCELKPSGVSEARSVALARRAVALVAATGARAQTMYISFSYPICLEIGRLDADAHVEYLEGDKDPTQLHADGIGGLDYNYRVFREHPEYIPAAKRLGLTLNAWTVNGEEDLKWLIGEGFDAITTNEPELALELFAASK